MSTTTVSKSQEVTKNNRPILPGPTLFSFPPAVFLDTPHRVRCDLARPMAMLHARPCIEHRGQIEDASSRELAPLYPLAHRHGATDVRLSLRTLHAPHVLAARPVLTAHCASSMGRVTCEVRGAE